MPHHVEIPDIANADLPPADAALWRLARCLYESMERLDPSYEGALWDDLTIIERDVFYFSICSVLLERSDVLRAMEINFAGDDVVEGSLCCRE